MRPGCWVLVEVLPSCALRGLERSREVSGRSRWEFVASADAAAEHRAEGWRILETSSLTFSSQLTSQEYTQTMTDVWRKPSGSFVEHRAGQFSISERTSCLEGCRTPGTSVAIYAWIQLCIYICDFLPDFIIHLKNDPPKTSGINLSILHYNLIYNIFCWKWEKYILFLS